MYTFNVATYGFFVCQEILKSVADASSAEACYNRHEGGVNMAVPKRRTSKAVTHQRKAANMKKKAPGISICPQCHEPKLPHRVCPNCNYYDGKDIMGEA